LEGVFDGIHVEEVKDLAIPFIQKLSLHVLTKETYRNANNDHGFRIQPSPLLLAFLDALPHALARENAEETKTSQSFFADLIQEFISTSNRNGVTTQNVMPTLHQIGIKFSSMCLEESLSRKCAGCGGIKTMTYLNDLCVKWVIDREVELVRNLLHILKDLPIELSRDAEEVVDVLIRVLRVSNRDLNYQDPAHSRSKLFHLLSIFCLELPSAQPAVRQAAHTCISLLVELSGKPASELLAPHRERTLAQIYTKPLRALPFANQIGVMEAVRYCLALDPPLAELNDELLRLLHETLSLADAEDLTGFARGGNIRQNNLDIIKLRVACIKLLTASMPITDFFVKQVQTRTRYVI
jgi:transformation/transcription domain-associated protein